MPAWPLLTAIHCSDSPDSPDYLALLQLRPCNTDDLPSEKDPNTETTRYSTIWKKGSNSDTYAIVSINRRKSSGGINGIYLTGTGIGKKDPTAQPLQCRDITMSEPKGEVKKKRCKVGLTCEPSRHIIPRQDTINCLVHKTRTDSSPLLTHCGTDVANKFLPCNSEFQPDSAQLPNVGAQPTDTGAQTLDGGSDRC